VVNYLAILKILKKHDKVSGGWMDSSSTILPLIESGKLYPSAEKLKKNVETLEKLFCKYLAEDKDKSRALESLREHDIKEESHTVTFVTGFSFGCVVGILFSALAAFAIADRTSDTFTSYFFTVDQNQSGVKTEIASAIPVFRAMFLIAFHILMWGLDLLVFERRKVNARFIMDADPRSFLKSNEVLLVSSSS
jgi:hypothetical protein